MYDTWLTFSRVINFLIYTSIILYFLKFSIRIMSEANKMITQETQGA